MDGPTLFEQLTYDDYFLLLGREGLQRVALEGLRELDAEAIREARAWYGRFQATGPEWIAQVEAFCDWLENSLALGIHGLNLRIPQGEERAA